MAHASGQGVFETPSIKLDWNTQETFRLLKSAPGTVYQECSDVEKTIYRDWVRGLLRNGEITVTFVKSDGSLREMRCTLNFDLIPKEAQPGVDLTIDHTKRAKTRSINADETQSVFDLDINQWRSFKYERIKKIRSDIVLG